MGDNETLDIMVLLASLFLYVVLHQFVIAPLIEKTLVYLFFSLFYVLDYPPSSSTFLLARRLVFGPSPGTLGAAIVWCAFAHDRNFRRLGLFDPPCLPL